jgi:integrase
MKRTHDRVQFTDRWLKALAKKPAPEGTRYTIWDSVVPGFGIRISDTGRRDFVVMRRVAGAQHPTRFSLGQYTEGEGQLAEARQKARDALDDMSLGRDPGERKRRAIEEEAKKRRDSVLAVAEEFFKRHTAKLKSGHKAEAVLRRELLGQELKRKDGKKEWVSGKDARLRDHAIIDVSRRDIVQLIESIIDRGHKHYARQTFAHVRTFFAWAVERSMYGLEHSPCELIRVSKLVGKLSTRKHVLDDEDIRRVWSGASEYPFGPFTKMLLLTGQRRNEVAKMRWSEIDIKKKLWTIPAERMKGDQAHLVPLSDKAIELLEGLPRFKGDYVFTTTGGERPISGFAKAKRALDKKASGAAKWIFHDLRRTVRTRLSELRVPDVVAELVIGHKKLGLHAVYDQHAYLNEKRDALDAWAKRLQLILTPPRGNVVKLHG